MAILRDQVYKLREGGTLLKQAVFTVPIMLEGIPHPIYLLYCMLQQMITKQDEVFGSKIYYDINQKICIAK